MASNTTEESTFTFHHPGLGSLTGLIQPDNVVQFRAVPYATIPARFKRSILLDSLPCEARQYTSHGSACPQIFPSRDADGGPFPGDPPTPASDEFSCLILQVNIPLSILQTRPAANLPVLVYIHGGGFILGKIDAQHCTAPIVQQSITDNQPLISVSIQYRLGALGYLHVPAPDSANLALHDQRNALLWVQRFISGFGGDSARVTVFGESAGAISICYHMIAAVPASGPLFNRAVLMSGVIGPATAPVSVCDAEARYEDLLTRLKIQERGNAGLDALRRVDVDAIVAVAAEMGDEGGMWLPVFEPGWFGEHTEEVTWDRVPELIGQCEWVRDIILGGTGFEGTMFASRYADVAPAEFLAGIEAQLGPQSAQIIAKAYGISSSMDKNLFLTSLMRWIGDSIFDAPTHLLATHLSTLTSKNIYRYIFDVRNPFPNHAMYQQPHHWVDVYFVFKAHQFRFPSRRLRNISTQHAQLWITFANGKRPWKEYVYTGKGEEVFMLADERDGWVERPCRLVEEDLEWGYGRCEELVKSWDRVRGNTFDVLGVECLRRVNKT